MSWLCQVNVLCFEWVKVCRASSVCWLGRDSTLFAPLWQKASAHCVGCMCAPCAGCDKCASWIEVGLDVCAC
jgi:hypothetical protein